VPRSVWHTSGSGRVGYYGARLGRASVMRLWRVCVYDERELVMIISDDVRSYTCAHAPCNKHCTHTAHTLHTGTLSDSDSESVSVSVYLAVVLNEIRSCVSRQCELLPFFSVPVAIIRNYGHGPRLKRCACITCMCCVCVLLCTVVYIVRVRVYWY